MYRTNLNINVNTNVSGTDGEDLVCNIFDDLISRISEFVDDGYDIFHISMNNPLLVKSEKSLIRKLPIIIRYLSKNSDLDETITNKFDYETGRYDELEINIKYNEYNPQNFNQRTGEYTVKFNKDKHDKIIANTNHGNTEYENKAIDDLIHDRFIEIGELLSVDWFLNNIPEWTEDWQNDEKTEVNRKALEYHGIDASNDETYQTFINVIKSIKIDTDKIFPNLYRMLVMNPLGKTTYEQYVKDRFEIMLMLSPSETLKRLNDMTLKFNLTDKLPSVATWSPTEEEED